MLIGIVAAKDKSTRLAGKNHKKLGGKPLYVHAIQKLVDVGRFDKVVFATDIPKRKIHPSVLKYSYGIGNQENSTMELPDVYAHVLKKEKIVDGTLVGLMPTNPFITSDKIDEALERYWENGNLILRSYGKKGNENGLYIVDIDVLLNGNQWDSRYDVYTGAIGAPGIEIHTKREWELTREKWKTS